MRKITLVLSLLFVAATAFAAPSPVTVNGNIVRAQVNGSCLMPASFDLNFGAYDPIDTHSAAALDGTTTWTLRCTKDLVVRVDLDLGTASTGPLVRRMTGAVNGDFLTYQLYKNNLRTLVWGTGADGGASGTGRDFTSLGLNAGTGTVLTIWGRIPQAQDVSVDDYEDTIVATLVF